MDLNAVKKRIASLKYESNSGTGEKIDYSTIYWKPKEEGEFQIRFVPSVLDKDNPFQDFYVIYGISQFPLSSLINWGEKCPISEFSQKLIGSGDTEKWKLGKKLEPKLRVFAPVIVRGEEEKGVRQLELSKTLYMELLTLADDEEYGSFEDINDGLDFKVVAKKADSGKGFSISLTPKRKNSVLSKDPKQVKEWLENQPNILEVKGKYKMSYDRMKEVLVKWLTPEEDVEDKDEVKVEEKSTFQLETKPNKSDEFDEMFEEELIKDDHDDLPF